MGMRGKKRKREKKHTTACGRWGFQESTCWCCFIFPSQIDYVSLLMSMWSGLHLFFVLHFINMFSLDQRQWLNYIWVNMAKCSRAQPLHVFTSALIDYNELEILEQQRRVWIEKTLWTPQGLKVETNRRRQCQFPDETGAWFQHGSHIWGNQRAVVLVSKQYQPSSPLTCHDHACKLNCGGIFVLCFSLQGGGAVFCLGWLCSGANEHSSYCHDSAVMLESISTKHSRRETRMRSQCLNTLRRDACERESSALRGMRERGHLKNNDYVWSYLHRRQKQMQLWSASRKKASLIKDKDVTTLVYHDKLFQ